MFTNRASLRWLLTIREPRGHLMRCHLRFLEYSFHVQSKKGAQNVHADTLSRLNTNAETTLGDRAKTASFFIDTPSDFPGNLSQRQGFRRIHDQLRKRDLPSRNSYIFRHHILIRDTALCCSPNRTLVTNVVRPVQ